MNIITGMISPLTNWARNDDSFSPPFCSVERLGDLAARPKTVTSSWPE